MKKDILGIKIDDINMDQALEKVSGWLSKPGKHYIVTPNPEIIVMAQKDKELKKILNSADLAIPDGTGLQLATDIVCNTPGIDFMENLIKVSHDRGFTIGFLGGRDRVAEKTAERLRSRYPKLKITFAESGGEVDSNGNPIQTTSFAKRANYKLPTTDLLFVALVPPKQEKWIAKNLPKLNVKVAMGVGGSFDFIAGKVPRAPKFIRNFGLEWLFRLAVQPWRIKRQLALIKYMLLLLTRS